MSFLSLPTTRDGTLFPSGLIPATRHLQVHTSRLPTWTTWPRKACVFPKPIPRPPLVRPPVTPFSSAGARQALRSGEPTASRTGMLWPVNHWPTYLEKPDRNTPVPISGNGTSANPRRLWGIGSTTGGTETEWEIQKNRKIQSSFSA